MNIIANENVSGSVIRGLRGAGYDVLSVKETMRGATDTMVLSKATADKRVVLTHDKDFGELAFRWSLPSQCGVILLRFSGADPVAEASRTIEVLQSRVDWAGHFSVIDDVKIRMRPIPSVSDDE